MCPAASVLPAPRRGVRLVHDAVRDRWAVLYPEGVLLLNETATAVLRACDGTRDVPAVAAELRRDYAGVADGDVAALVADLVERRLLTTDPAQAARPRGAAVDTTWGDTAWCDTTGERSAPSPDAVGVAPDATAPPPLGLLAEVTYRCPLHCPYCSNPLNLADYRAELTTDEWRRVFTKARAAGVLQVHLSGGEPLLRPDLVELVDHAHRLGMYTSLVTSGIPLTLERFDALVAAGLDHVQLSVQDADAAAADAVAGITAHERKLVAAAMVTGHGLPLTVNAVLHRANIARVTALVDLADRLGADRLELANTQYYGWGARNWAALLPSREAIGAAEAQVRAARERLGGRMEIVYVLADYYENRPKPCVYGWGMRQLVVAPDGRALPCPSAAQLPGLEPVNVREASVAEIWYRSQAFGRFRGTDWLPEPCAGCALKEIDFGGCRCQAYQLTGDAAATDPVCGLSPHHHVVERLLAGAATREGTEGATAPRWVPRRMTVRAR